MGHSPTFSIIVPTCGRDTLARTLVALAPQLGDGDEIICVRDDNAPWGHATRNRVMSRAVGSHLWFMDDDDVPAEGALDVIRNRVAEAPGLVHIFKMQMNDGQLIWEEPVACVGNVGTPMMVVPNNPGELGVWDETCCEGDGEFLMDTIARRNNQPPVFHPEVVALIRPE